MSTAEYERGQTDARLDISDERHLENLQRFKEIEAKLDEVVNALAIAKGGLRILLAVGSFSATIGILAHSILSWVWAHLK